MKNKILIGSLLLLVGTLAHAEITPKYYKWMNGEIKYSAWDKGYTGQGTQIVILDFFTTTNPFYAKLDNVNVQARHGSHVAKMARLLAPNSTIKHIDYYDKTRNELPIDSTKLNVINASFSVFMNKDVVKPGEVSGNYPFLVQSLIDHAHRGRSVVVKAAGNYGVNMGEHLTSGTYTDREDALNTSLLTSKSAIFAGALSNFGTSTNKASLASYSNKAGLDLEFQKRFLVTGVRSYEIGVAGTSLAAPIISSYASILGSKFKTATPTQVANQLLSTARTDTLVNYDPSIYGRGEVSLSRALSPVSLK